MYPLSSISVFCAFVFFVFFSYRINYLSYRQVIPPGMEFNHIVPPHDGDMDGETEGGEDHQASPDPPIRTEVQVISDQVILSLRVKIDSYCIVSLPHVPLLMFLISVSFHFIALSVPK